MRITLDDQENFALTSNPGTLGALLLEITAHLQTTNRAIQTVLLDGENVPPEAMTPEWGARPTSEAQSLVITTASLRDLAIDALDEIADVLPELPVACHELAQILSGEMPAEGFALFNQLFDIWEVLKERQHQVAGSLGLDLSAVTLDSETAIDHDARLHGILARARAFMESSQFPELADLLSHDLIDLAEAEARYIEVLRESAGS